MSSWAENYGGAENMVAVIQTALEMSGDLTGFTLFEVRDGWQMSLRPRKEGGWIVTKISAEKAEKILAGLENGSFEIWGSLDGPKLHQLDTPMSMAEALEADGKKLRQLTGEDHGPFDYNVFLAREAGIEVDEPVRPQLVELIDRWKLALTENMAAREPDSQPSRPLLGMLVHERCRHGKTIDEECLDCIAMHFGGSIDNVA